MHIKNLPRGEDKFSQPGFNYRVSELTAAIALGQLERMDQIILKQKLHKKKLVEELKYLKKVMLQLEHK